MGQPRGSGRRHVMAAKSGGSHSLQTGRACPLSILGNRNMSTQHRFRLVIQSLIPVCSVALALSIAASTYAAALSWDNSAGDGLAANPANWTPAQVPTA